MIDQERTAGERVDRSGVEEKSAGERRDVLGVRVAEREEAAEARCLRQVETHVPSIEMSCFEREREDDAGVLKLRLVACEARPAAPVIGVEANAAAKSLLHANRHRVLALRMNEQIAAAQRLRFLHGWRSKRRCCRRRTEQ